MILLNVCVDTHNKKLAVSVREVNKLRTLTERRHCSVSSELRGEQMCVECENHKFYRWSRKKSSLKSGADPGVLLDIGKN